MEEIREILTVNAQSTQAATSAPKAVKKAVEDKNSSTTDWSKLIAKPNIFDYKSQEEEIKVFKEWSWVFEMYLRSVDGAYTKDLKEFHDKPNEKFDMELATGEKKTRCIKLDGLIASLMRGGALQLLKAVEDSNVLALMPQGKL